MCTPCVHRRSGAPAGTATTLPQLTDSYRFIYKISEWRIAGVSLWMSLNLQKWTDYFIHNLARKRQINSELIGLLIGLLEMAFANFIRIDTCPAASTRCVNSALLDERRENLRIAALKIRPAFNSRTWRLFASINYALMPRSSLSYNYDTDII